MVIKYRVDFNVKIYRNNPNFSKLKTPTTNIYLRYFMIFYESQEMNMLL